MMKRASLFILFFLLIKSSWSIEWKECQKAGTHNGKVRDPIDSECFHLALMDAHPNNIRFNSLSGKREWLIGAPSMLIKEHEEKISYLAGSQTLIEIPKATQVFQEMGLLAVLQRGSVKVFSQRLTGNLAPVFDYRWDEKIYFQDFVLYRNENGQTIVGLLAAPKNILKLYQVQGSQKLQFIANISLPSPNMRSIQYLNQKIFFLARDQIFTYDLRNQKWKEVIRDDSLRDIMSLSRDNHQILLVGKERELSPLKND